MKKLLLFIITILLPMTVKADKSGKCGANLTWTYIEATKTLTVSGEGNMNSSNFALWGDISGDIENVIIEEGVTSIGNNAFRGCKNIKTLLLGNSITLIGDKAFTGCSSLSSVIIPNSVTTIDIWAFSNCSSLKTLSIGNGVTSIGRGAFKGCTDLETLEIGDCNTSIGIEAFGECSSLTALVIPDKVISIGDIAFQGCNSLTSVTIGNGVESIGYSAFDGCPNITNLSMGKGVKTIGEKAFYNCDKIPSVIIPNSTISIGNSAFAACRNLNTLVIGDNVSSIGEESFASCGKIESIIIPSSMKSIGNRAFEFCNGISSLYLNNGLTSIGAGVFHGCKNLKEIIVPNSVTAIGESAFMGCEQLEFAYLSDGIRIIPRYLFSGCSSLKSIHLPIELESIDIAAFSQCSSLVSIDIPNTVIDLAPSYYSNITNTLGTFSNCSSLEKINIPEKVKKIPGYFLYGCANLTSISFPDSVTMIDIGTLSGCTRLKKIELGSSVSILDKLAFEDCHSLDTLISKSEIPPSTWTDYKGRDAFYKVNLSYVTLFVPQTSKELYKSKTPWSSFKSIRSIGAHYLRLRTGGEGTIKYKETQYRGLNSTLDIDPNEEVILEFIPDEGHGITWLKVNDKEITPPTITYTFAKLDEDTKVEVWFSPNWYKLTYMIDKEVYDEHIVLYGGTIKPISAPIKEGYTFSGWSEIPETMPAHDVTVTGTFSINSYKLTYMIDDKVYKETMYDYGANITPEPQPAGDYQTFEWTDLPQTMPAHDVIVYASYTSGIAEILMSQGNGRIYSPDGKLRKELQKGLNIVRTSDGSTRKVVVK